MVDANWYRVYKSKTVAQSKCMERYALVHEALLGRRGIETAVLKGDWIGDDRVSREYVLT